MRDGRFLGPTLPKTIRDQIGGVYYLLSSLCFAVRFVD
jgi:hypothetical protein